MKKIFEEWVFLFACCLVLTCFLHLPESNHSVNLDLLFLAHVSSSLDVFIPVLLGTVDQVFLPLGTSAKIIFYNEQELRNIHCVPLTDGARHLLCSGKN